MIGQRIKELRNQNNLTQEALSEGIISRTYLSLIEKGSVEPSNNVLIKLSERLGVAVSNLMEESATSIRDPITIRREIVFNENKLNRNDITRVDDFIEETKVFVKDLDSLDQGRTYLIYARYYYFKKLYKEAIKYVQLAHQHLKEISISTYYVECTILYAELYIKENDIDAALDLLEPLYLEIIINKMYTFYHRDILETFVIAYFKKSSYYTVTRLYRQLESLSLEHRLLLSEQTKNIAMISLYETRDFDTLKEVLKQNDSEVSNLLKTYCLLNEGDIKHAHELFKTLNNGSYQNEHVAPIYKEIKDRMGSL